MTFIVSCNFLQYLLIFYQDYGSCVRGDWFGEVREVDLADLKQEPDDVCCVEFFVLPIQFIMACISIEPLKSLAAISIASHLVSFTLLIAIKVFFCYVCSCLLYTSPSPRDS